jgi:hypothetical protein
MFILLAMAPYFGLVIILCFGMLSACFVFVGEIWNNRADNISIDVMDSIEMEEDDSDLRLNAIDSEIRKKELLLLEVQEKIVLVQNAIRILECEKNALEISMAEQQTESSISEVEI